MPLGLQVWELFQESSYQQNVEEETVEGACRGKPQENVEVLAVVGHGVGHQAEEAGSLVALGKDSDDENAAENAAELAPELPEAQQEADKWEAVGD